MTASDRTTLLAIAALLRAPSPSKDPVRRYGRDDWNRALARVADRLTYAPFARPRTA